MPMHSTLPKTPVLTLLPTTLSSRGRPFFGRLKDFDVLGKALPGTFFWSPKSFGAGGSIQHPRRSVESLTRCFSSAMGCIKQWSITLIGCNHIFGRCFIHPIPYASENQPASLTIPMPVGHGVVLVNMPTTDLEIGGGQKRVSWPVMELFGSGCKREKFSDRIWTFQIAQPDNNDRRRQFRSLDILVLLYQDKRTG